MGATRPIILAIALCPPYSILKESQRFIVAFLQYLLFSVNPINNNNNNNTLATRTNIFDSHRTSAKHGKASLHEEDESGRK